MKTERNALCPCGSGLKFKKCHGSPTLKAAPAAPAASSRASRMPDRLFAQALDHHTSGEFDAASVLYSELLAAHPSNPDVLHNLGLVLLQQGQVDEALNRLDAAIAAAPHRANFHASRAGALVSSGRFAEAAAAYDGLGSALDKKSLHNQAVALGRLGRTAQAISICEHLLGVDSADAAAHALKGNLLTDSGDFRAAESAYREALRLRPDDVATVSNLLLMLNYSDALGAAELMVTHRELGARIDGIWHELPAHHVNSRKTDRRLRLGLVSPDLGEHPVGYLLLPWVAGLDQGSFELCFFSTRLRNDSLNKRLRGMATQWHECQGMNDTELAAQIRREQVDILVDLAGHTAGNRLGAFARGPAPVQISYLGYPTSTGLASIGYRLTDATVDPAGCDAGTEQPVRLSSGMFRYEPPADIAEPAPPPALMNGHVTFGCFCNLSKVTASARSLWAQVLAAVPGSRLLVKAGALNDAASVDRLRAQFASVGVAPDRIDAMGWSDHQDHLAAFARMDVMLDTVPFNLAGNTCEALWMGVPVLSLRGDRPGARMGASLLDSAGRSAWVAQDPADFVSKAVALTADVQALADLRAGQRAHLLKSRLLDGASLAEEMGSQLKRLFAAWATNAALPPTSGLRVLHVGCGSPEAGKLPAYFDPQIWKELRLDIDQSVKPDFIASTTDMHVVPNASVQALYSSHNIEHLLVSEVPKALAEFARVLEPGGFALVTLPDLRVAAERVLRDEQDLPLYHSPAGPINALDMIYGYAPFVEGGNNFMLHKTGFTAVSLQRTLTRAGFDRVVVRSHGYALWAVAYKPLA
jgi:protein O-GlcNAc transferase